jgi:hypothetical protein
VTRKRRAPACVPVSDSLQRLHTTTLVFSNYKNRICATALPESSEFSPTMIPVCFGSRLCRHVDRQADSRNHLRASSCRALSANRRGVPRVHACVDGNDLYFGPCPGHRSLREAARLGFSQLRAARSCDTLRNAPLPRAGSLHALDLFGLWGDVPEFPRGSGALVGSRASRWPVQLLLVTARALVAAAPTQTLVQPAAEPPVVAVVQAAVADSKV